MPAHRILVSTQKPDGTIWEAGELVDYDGEPRWQFEPVDAKARSSWLLETFDAAKYARTPDRHRVDLADDEPFIQHTPDVRQVPPSGWQVND